MSKQINTTKRFIVLSASGDGDYSLNYITAEEIKKGYLAEDCKHPIFDRLPDLGYCGRGILIIDGTIVIPKPKEVIKDWDIG